LPEKKSPSHYDIETEDATDPEETAEKRNLSHEASSQPKAKKQKQPSVWKTVVRTFGPYYMLGGIFKLVYDLITFVNPILLK
jgi:hypothetical protein